ncbi:heavy metal sensor histidine kinase [Undibacterium parvum]|uniref:Sensor protein n=2 Tax=Undibacterium TaxID=401469 RepID=A0A6M4A7L2_9BURK|nr:heavy metal sensor histidine kinase [Undibacterium parvum]AZP12487.1 HAMP domain-containing protein [Undibacterium parvum]QJQ06710.1 heavy metal sensor histidine kinase [Undibacterium piscinae]
MIKNVQKFRKISLTLRLTILFACLSTTVLLMLGVLVGASEEEHFIEQDMELMSGKLDLVAHLLDKTQDSSGLDNLAGLLNDSLVGHHGLSVVILQPDGSTLFASHDAQFPASLLDRRLVKKHPMPVTWQQTVSSERIPMRGISALLPSGIAGSTPLLVALAVDISHHEHFMASFRKTLWLAVGIAALVVSILGWAIVKHGLAPLQAIRQGAAGVTADSLNYRLGLEAIPVELADLAESLNNMLARLEDSFQRLKDFSTDLAHELRTPISNLMTQTQVALSRTRSEEEYREVLASNVEEYERLARMIADMLFLAQAENGLIVLNREAVDLAKEIEKLFDFFDALAEERQLRLSLVGTGHYHGDKLMLRRALANLLSNAIRHSPIAGDIQFSIDQKEQQTIIRIRNQGEAIPAEHISHIFDRFYRADPSRHSNGEGAGLGLSITRSIILAHGGEIFVESGLTGVCFEIHLK